MFARQVDPLAAFTSSLSAAEAHRRQDKDTTLHHHHCHQNFPFTSSPHSSSSCSSTSHPSTSNSNDNNSKKDSIAASSSTYNPYKRKHPLQFEPEFFAALDASLQEFHDDAAQHSDGNGCWKASLSNLNGGSPWPSRPCKRAKNSLSKCPATSQLTESTSRQPLSSGSSSARPRTPSPTPFFNPNQTTTIPHSDSANRNNETEPDPPLFQRKTPLVFPQASSPISAWSHRNAFSKSSAFVRNSKGPSIIDLSSGEELVPIHMVDKEQHKRRRNSSCEPSSPSEIADSLHQIFELQTDGTLLPILDPSPSDPSPAKRMRLSKANRCQYLHFLSDDECELDRLSTKMKADVRRRKAHNDFIGSNRTHRTTSLGRVARSGGSAATEAGSSYAHEEPYFGANGLWTEHAMDTTVSGILQEGVLSDQEHQMQHEEPNAKGGQSSLDPNYPDHQAMILYKGARSVSLTPHCPLVDWGRWMNDQAIGHVDLNELQGHEMVLYQREPIGQEPSSRFNRTRSIIWEEDDNQESDLASSVMIEELNEDDDDDGNLADDEECDLSDDAPLMDLEEQVTDMDLD
ncbi:hypothetical protein BG015_004150 [Linnemannia schmuckeri]|uniref:Uncharacterized protein n=1 Tax=Linnemannia schmuckeri TaxID=64567 RepID=A0A9P5S847_9FUNG|nr:hypothetical protein BG015_004150 [Linnemannia schmuckeri]